MELAVDDVMAGDLLDLKSYRQAPPLHGVNARSCSGALYRVTNSRSDVDSATAAVMIAVAVSA